MSDNESPIEQQSNGWADALATVALLAIVLTTVVFWLSSQ